LAPSRGQPRQTPGNSDAISLARHILGSYRYRFSLSYKHFLGVNVFLSLFSTKMFSGSELQCGLCFRSACFNTFQIILLAFSISLGYTYIENFTLDSCAFSVLASCTHLLESVRKTEFLSLQSTLGHGSREA
jgi:hypothetical protein